LGALRLANDQGAIGASCERQSARMRHEVKSITIFAYFPALTHGMRMRMLRSCCITGWFVAGLSLLSLPVAAEPISAERVRVIDSDTVRLFNKRPDVRLIGFNAPETRRAQCAAERALGDKATRRLRDLVREQPLDFVAVDCSCKRGTEGTTFCNYGRSCGTLKAGGRDVGEILIAERLAVLQMLRHLLPKNASTVVPVSTNERLKATLCSKANLMWRKGEGALEWSGSADFRTLPLRGPRHQPPSGRRPCHSPPDCGRAALRQAGARTSSRGTASASTGIRADCPAFRSAHWFTYSTRWGAKALPN